MIYAEAMAIRRAFASGSTRRRPISMAKTHQSSAGHSEKDETTPLPAEAERRKMPELRSG